MAMMTKSDAPSDNPAVVEARERLAAERSVFSAASRAAENARAQEREARRLADPAVAMYAHESPDPVARLEARAALPGLEAASARAEAEVLRCAARVESCREREREALTAAYQPRLRRAARAFSEALETARRAAVGLSALQCELHEQTGLPYTPVFWSDLMPSSVHFESRLDSWRSQPEVAGLIDTADR